MAIVVNVWDDFLTEGDKSFRRSLPGKVPLALGSKPAILSIDNNRGAFGDRPEPLIEATKSWPTSTGFKGWAALKEIAGLFQVSRDAGVPIVHLTGLPTEESGVPSWAARLGFNQWQTDTPEGRDRYRQRDDFVDELAPVEGEVVLRKTAPSAFFGTPLAAYLVSQRIDTLIVCGNSTSGCVRATVVDGCSHHFQMIVPEECTFDRTQASHAINLFDMNEKYADVVPKETVLDWLRTGVTGPAVG